MTKQTKPSERKTQKSREVKELAIKLYFNLPFYKRWRTNKFYISNNWDMLGNWEKCIKQAIKMIDDADTLLK